MVCFVCGGFVSVWIACGVDLLIVDFYNSDLFPFVYSFLVRARSVSVEWEFVA